MRYEIINNIINPSLKKQGHGQMIVQGESSVSGHDDETLTPAPFPPSIKSRAHSSGEGGRMSTRIEHEYEHDIHHISRHALHTRRHVRTARGSETKRAKKRKRQSSLTR